MTQVNTVDNLVRSTLHAEFSQQEPSSTVRETLLAQAASDNVMRSSLGPSIPPLADALCENAGMPLDSEQHMLILTSSLLGRRHLFWLAAPLYAVR